MTYCTKCGKPTDNGIVCEDCIISDSPWLLAMKRKEDDLAEEVAKLKAENAALRERLKNAAELPYTEKCKEYTKIIYKNNYGDIEDETYFHDCFYGENKNIRGDIYAEARLAELKGEKE